MAREQVEAAEQGAGADVARRRRRRGCARSWASRSRRSRSSTCRCRGRRRRRSTRSTPTRSRSTKAAKCRGSKRFRTSSARSSSIPTSRWRTRCCRASTPTPASRRWRRSSRSKAFELRDRVSERERFFISWRYYRDATQAGTRRSSWRGPGRRRIRAKRSRSTASGSALIRLGQFEQSVEPFREAIRLDPKFVPAYSNLAASLLALNRLRRGAGRASARRPTASSISSAPAGCRTSSRSSQGDSTTMARELEASVGVGETNAAFGWQAHASAFGGRVNDGARAVPPRHPDVAAGELHGSGGAADDGRRRDARDRRPVRRGARARWPPGSR